MNISALPAPVPLPAAADGPLSHRVYEQLLAMLGTEALVRDARLPSELEMSRRFDVSRPVLRQALARLRAEGRIYARKGSGNFVGDPGPPIQAIAFGPLTSIPDVRSFLEFRCSLESESAARAAARCDGKSVREIQMQRRRFEQAVQAGHSGVEEDIAFHAAIARASGNRFYALTMAALADQTRFAIQLVRDLSDRTATNRFADVRREHAAIEAAISAGEVEAARSAITAHLKGGIARMFGR